MILELNEMIGILTFIGTQSHGACLQAYALKEKITELGYEAVIIPYQCPELKREMDKRLPTARGNLKKRIGNLVRYPIVGSRYRKFRAFEKKYLCPGELSNTIDFSKYNRIIAGSDQIWNLEVTGGDYTFFLEGVDKQNKATYAASLGMDSFPKEEEKRCIALIDDIPVINVREKKLREYLQEKLPGRKIGLVLDPTQILDAQKWKKLAGETPIIKRKYMFVHFPAENPESWEAISRIAKEKNLEVVVLSNKIKRRKGYRSIYSADPFEYLNLVRFADFVVTGSFHTLSFSLLFERDFLCTASMIASRNSRLSSLLEIAGCSDRVISSVDSMKPIHFADVKKRLDAARENSVVLLKEACEG